MSACIIPVAPNFQDPPSPPDPPPYLSNPNPKNFNDIVSVPVPAGQTFSATVKDPDVEAKLNYRWVLDYPPFIRDVTLTGNQGSITAPPDGQPINMPLSQPIDCNFVNTTLAPSDGKHQLELIVANRTFSTSPALTPDDQLDSIDDSTGSVVRATWTIVISCPATTSTTSGSP